MHFFAIDMSKNMQKLLIRWSKMQHLRKFDCEMIIKNGYTLHYYKKLDRTLEIEFLVEKMARFVGERKREKYTNNFISENNLSIA